MKKLSLLFLLSLIIAATTLYGQDEFDALRKKATELSPTTLISVSIGGNFFINGTFSAFINERLDHFLTRVIYTSLGGNNDEDQNSSTASQLNMLMEQTVKRNIKIIKPSGAVSIIDLEKFYLTGDINQNPYIQQDDLIIFPTINLETNYIIVDGAVNKRLKFSFVEGDKLSDALLFAHGVDAAYNNVSWAEIIRVSYDGQTTSRDTVSLNQADSIKLMPGDIVRVIGENYERKDYKVLVVGEVNKPGYIYISKNKTSLGEVIQRAGGFKNTAWLEYSELIRGTTPDKKVKQELITSSYDNNQQIDNSIIESFRPSVDTERWKMFRTSDLYDDHYDLFRLDVDLALGTKNRLVDFKKLNGPNSPEEQFIVEDGDVIYIPEIMELVYVMGQVVNPGQYHYKKEYRYLDYIKRAGGLAESADSETEVYVINGKSYNWVKVNQLVSIEPGDYIWVKKDPARSFNFYLSRVSAVTGIIGSIATIVLLVSQLIK